MLTNIVFSEPNMAMFTESNQLKYYNMSWNGNPFLSTLLVRTANGQGIVSYPSDIEFPLPIDSLDYDGVYFWTVRPLNDTPYYPGFILEKWYTASNSYSLTRSAFQCMPGPYKANALATEYYNLPILNSVTSNDTVVSFSSPTYDYILNRVEIGDEFKIGPNTQGNVFYATVLHKQQNIPSACWDITLSSNFNATYIATNNAFVECRVYVFDAGGTLGIFHPSTLSVENTYQRDFFRNVDGTDFCPINVTNADIPQIKVGTRSLCLFYSLGLEVYCLDIENANFPDPTALLCVQNKYLNFDVNGNSTIPIYDMRINPNCAGSTCQPQFNFLQKRYRDSIDTNPADWATYNYTTMILAAQPTYMVVATNPAYLTPSGIVNCRCTVLDNYRNPVNNVSVTWSATTGAGKFITATGTLTNSSGIAYATFSGSANIPFPSYITANTTAM